MLLATKSDLIFSEPMFLQNDLYEAKWSRMEFPKSRPLYICSLYIPDTSDALTCLEELRSDLYKIFSKHENTPPLIYICDDLNLRDIDWSDMTTTNPQTAKYHDKLFEILDEFGVQNVQKEATRPASGKSLDFVITNMPTTINSFRSGPRYK